MHCDLLTFKETQYFIIFIKYIIHFRFYFYIDLHYFII